MQNVGVVQSTTLVLPLLRSQYPTAGRYRIPSSFPFTQFLFSGAENKEPHMRRRRHGAPGTSRDGAKRRTVVREETGTTTQTATTQTGDSEGQAETNTPTLRLHLTRRRRVRFTADTHDNEHENKKSSKSCCIFHKKRSWDESSTESDDEGGAESDGSSSDGGPSRKPVRRKLPQDRDMGECGPSRRCGGDERS